ncbi:MAG: FG-GAP-like repeat-containing protein [Flavobacteriales bacterium]
MGAQAQNTCAEALPVGAGSHVVDALNGPEVPSPDCFGNMTNVDYGEWYTYTPTTDLGLTITTDLEINSGGDTRFHVYTGTCGSLTCVGGDDDDGVIGNGYLSIDRINVSAGVTYTIVFDDRWNEGGFTFDLIEGPEFIIPPGFTNVTNPTEGRVLAAVDMNNDGMDDIVTIDSTRIIIHFQQEGGGFEVTTFTTTEANFEPSWSLCAGDLDGNGHNDLLYGGGSGVTFMFANSDGTGYTEVSGPQYVFSQRSNMIDINNDGNLDAFVCHDVQPNVFYMNDGTGNLVYQQGGLGDTPNGGNYGSIWVDYDNDRDMDLFIAKCRGGENIAAIDQLHRNNGDGTFTEIAESVNLAAGYHQSWSSAWGDFDLDGDLDVLVGASSLSFGGHRLMRNDGGTFTDVTEGSGFDLFTGTTTEWTTHDFDNDGRLDILGGGALYFGTGDLTFAFGLSLGNHAIGDLNNDGFLDILGTSSIRMNNGNTNNWLKVNTIGTVSNRNGIGARVEVVSNLGTQLRDVKSGDGFRYMSSLMTHFGLGDDEVIDELRVLWPSGIINVLYDVPVNSTIDVVEGVNTDVVAVEANDALRVFPNPADDVLYFEMPTSNKRQVAVYDMAGQCVLEPSMLNNRLDITPLTTGMYVLELQQDGQIFHQKFSKR